MPCHLRPADAYEKGEHIGEGTFGVVVKATQTSTGRTVAIKKLRSQKSSSARLGTKLETLREIMLLQEMRHDNVIELIEVYCHNQSISLVFEFCVMCAGRQHDIQLAGFIRCFFFPPTSILRLSRNEELLRCKGPLQRGEGGRPRFRHLLG